MQYNTFYFNAILIYTGLIFSQSEHSDLQAMAS